MDDRGTTHRLDQDGALCGARGVTLTPVDAVVSCPTCLALMALAAERRRRLVRRSVVLIGKLASA